MLAISRELNSIITLLISIVVLNILRDYYLYLSLVVFVFHELIHISYIRVFVD